MVAILEVVGMATLFHGALETHTCAYTSHDAKPVHCNPIPVLQTGIMFVVLRGGYKKCSVLNHTHVLQNSSWAAPSAAKTQLASIFKRGICRLQYVEVYTTTGTVFVGRCSLLGIGTSLLKLTGSVVALFT